MKPPTAKQQKDRLANKIKLVRNPLVQEIIMDFVKKFVKDEVKHPEDMDNVYEKEFDAIDTRPKLPKTPFECVHNSSDGTITKGVVEKIFPNEHPSENRTDCMFKPEDGPVVQLYLDDMMINGKFIQPK